MRRWAGKECPFVVEEEHGNRKRAVDSVCAQGAKLH